MEMAGLSLKIAFFLCALFTIQGDAKKYKPRIVGGGKASDEVLRHLVKLELTDESGETWICTGSVLDSYHILSAAHCVFESDATISIKDSYAYIAQKESSPDDAQKYYFDRVWIPRKWYRSEEAGHDIAVIKLETEIDGEDYEPVTMGDEPDAGTKVIAAGYGLKSNDGELPNFALQTTVVARSFDDCKNEDELAEGGVLKEKFLVCAVSVGYPDEGKTDSCQGDSGGPLFVKEDGELIQYGITAFSYYDCAEEGGIPWYVRLSTFKPQIEKILGKGFNKKWREL